MTHKTLRLVSNNMDIKCRCLHVTYSDVVLEARCRQGRGEFDTFRRPGKDEPRLNRRRCVPIKRFQKFPSATCIAASDSRDTIASDFCHIADVSVCKSISQTAVVNGDFVNRARCGDISDSDVESQEVAKECSTEAPPNVKAGPMDRKRKRHDSVGPVRTNSEPPMKKARASTTANNN